MIVTVTPIQLDDIMIITQKGYALRFNADEVPVVGAKAVGVKAINLKDDDKVQAVFMANTQSSTYSHNELVSNVWRRPIFHGLSELVEVSRFFVILRPSLTVSSQLVQSLQKMLELR